MPLKAERRPLQEENERLRARLDELEETLRAVRTGEVDALVVETNGGDQVFTLKSADQTYRMMVEEMQTGAATLSGDAVVLYCNPCLAAMLDVPVDAALGAPLPDYLDEQGAVALLEMLQAGSGVARGEISFRRHDASVPTQVSVTPLSLDGARVFCMVVTDLTERRRREEERAQLERERAARATAEEASKTALGEIERRKGVEATLRQAATQRIELLEREQKARAEAEQANRLKDEFLATLSHELRSPLNAIVAWSHILGNPGLDPATARLAVQTIDRNARAQAQLVGDILDVSQIITGKFRLSLDSVHLPDVIRAAANTMRPAAQAKNIRIELALDPTAGPVSGDPSRLQQVIWNLLSNAIKFAPMGGAVLVRLEDAGAFLELSVADDGPGIDPAFVPYVFDRFRQADSSSTRLHSGLGLGLAIVRHLVELHGGSVEARNREGRPGAEFIVRLPRQQSASPDDGSTERSTPAQDREGSVPPPSRMGA